MNLTAQQQAAPGATTQARSHPSSARSRVIEHVPLQVNQKLVPDFVERKLYINCLQLLFRLLDSLAATFRITVCGHDVRVSFEAIKDENGKSISVEERAQKLSSSLTPLDLDAVASFARESGAAPEEDKATPPRHKSTRDSPRHSDRHVCRLCCRRSAAHSRLRSPFLSGTMSSARAAGRWCRVSTRRCTLSCWASSTTSSRTR